MAPHPQSAPFPQFIYDFTAARGIAIIASPSTALPILNQINLIPEEAINPILHEVKREIAFHLEPVLRGDPVEPKRLDLAVGALNTDTAMALHTVLSHKDTVDSPAAAELANIIVTMHYLEPMTEQQKSEALLLMSVKYALPRMTAAVHTVIDHVREVWHELSEETQSTLKLQIWGALDHGITGSRFDRQAWADLLAFADENSKSTAHSI